MYDLGSSNTTPTKSKFDKTNYKNKIAGITNQLAYTRDATYSVPYPHCKHECEIKGVPIKSVHRCANAKCYGYFGIDDVKITILSEEKQLRHGFQVTPIYSTSIFNHDIDKLADVWSSRARPKLDERIIVNH